MLQLEKIFYSDDVLIKETYANSLNLLQYFFDKFLINKDLTQIGELGSRLSGGTTKLF